MSQLSEERETFSLQLQTAKFQLDDVIEMLEGLEMTKGKYCPILLHMRD